MRTPGHLFRFIIPVLLRIKRNFFIYSQRPRWKFSSGRFLKIIKGLFWHNQQLPASSFMLFRLVSDFCETWKFTFVNSGVIFDDMLSRPRKRNLYFHATWLRFMDHVFLLDCLKILIVNMIVIYQRWWWILWGGGVNLSPFYTEHFERFLPFS